MNAVALTGGIATGKSTVARLLAQHDIPLLDTDHVAADISAPSGSAIPALLKEFGPDCLTADGALDRPRMRNIVFSDASARARLEGILHPLIRERVNKFLADQGSARCAVAIPLYFEALGYAGRFREVVVVDCPTGVQLDRLVNERKMDLGVAQAILTSQSRRCIRLQLADRVLVNNADMDALSVQVSDWVRQWT
ncbi:MAG: dephospho-CoA kinase [Burkholderiales bacterium]|nr:dephospho-CoA kinase [Burkholderiales bacterium]